MREPCCADPAEGRGAGRCPISGSVGQPVKWTTMVALSAVPVPPRQQVSLCLDASCEVVYFGDRGLELRAADLYTVPAFKDGGDPLACYCFRFSREAIEQEALALSASPTLELIRRRVKEKRCACELRNPTGKCCLRDVQRMVEEISRKGVTA